MLTTPLDLQAVCLQLQWSCTHGASTSTGVVRIVPTIPLEWLKPRADAEQRHTLPEGSPRPPCDRPTPHVRSRSNFEVDGWLKVGKAGNGRRTERVTSSADAPRLHEGHLPVQSLGEMPKGGVPRKTEAARFTRPPTMMQGLQPQHPFRRGRSRW